MREKFQEMDLILKVLTRYFEKGIQEAKNALDEKRIQFYKSARNACMNFRHRLLNEQSPQILTSIQKCSAYILSTDPNMATLKGKIQCSDKELGYQYLTPLKNTCQASFNDIYQKANKFRNDSTLEFEKLDQKKHSSVEYYFLISFIAIAGVFPTALGIESLIKHHAYPNSSDQLSHWLFLALGLAFIFVAGYLLHRGEYPSIGDTMIRFDETHEEFLYDIAIEDPMMPQSTRQ